MERTYRIRDVVKEDFLRFPLALLANPKYKAMSLEAKLVYALLLNRLSLSQKNGWVNVDGEVYLIYTREEVSAVLNISYKKAIAAFKELIEQGLLYEQRQGRGYPNLLYVLKLELSDREAVEFTEDFNQGEQLEEPDVIQANQDHPERPAGPAHQDLPKPHVLMCKSGTSGSAGMEALDLPNRKPRKNHTRKPKRIQTDPPSIQRRGMEEDADELEEIYAQCDLSLFQANIQVMFRAAVERMYYSESLKVGNARLPQAKVRSALHLLDAEILMGALDCMKQNKAKVANPTAYLMSVIFNGICAKDSSLILSLPPEYLEDSDFFIPKEDPYASVESP